MFLIRDPVNFEPQLDVSVHGADDIDEGGWEVHGAHDIEQVLPSNPWVCIVLICEDNESWCACGVAVLYDILGIGMSGLCTTFFQEGFR